MLDWHRSDASQWLGTDGSDPARFMHRCRYDPLTSGRRRPLWETIQCPDHIFRNTGDREATFGGVTMQGSAVIKQKKPMEVMPVGGYGKLNVGSPLWRDEIDAPFFEEIAPDRGCAKIVLDRAVFGLGDPPPVRALDDEQAPVDFEDYVVSATEVTLRPGARAMRYIIAAEEQ